MSHENESLKLWHIKRFNLLAGMTQEELMRIAAQTRMTKHVRGSFIYLPGDPASSVYFLKEGSIKLTKLAEGGWEVLLEMVGPGEIFGELAVLQADQHSDSAQASEDALLREMRRQDFEDLLRSYPQMTLAIYKRVGLRLRKIENRLLDIICKDVHTRVREALIDLIGSNERADAQTGVKIPLTQQDIANLIGASRKEIAKVLKRLEDEGAFN